MYNKIQFMESFEKSFTAFMVVKLSNDTLSFIQYEVNMWLVKNNRQTTEQISLLLISGFANSCSITILENLHLSC